MPAKYYLKENPGSRENDEKQPLHPRLLHHGTISTESLIKEIAEESTYTEADLEGMIAAISRKMCKHLSEGYRVELGQLGYFSAKLTARPVTDQKEIRSYSVFFDNVNFRASRWFRKNIGGEVERAKPSEIRASANLSDKELKTRLVNYLKENEFITRIKYTNLTGRLKKKALEDLRRFEQEGVIRSIGYGNKLMFALPKENT